MSTAQMLFFSPAKCCFGYSFIMNSDITQILWETGLFFMDGFCVTTELSVGIG